MLRAIRGPRWARGGRGVTLVEMLVSTTLFTVVMAGVYLVYTTMQQTMLRGETKTDLQQSGRIAMGRMVQEIRMMGYDPSGALSLVTVLPRGGLRAGSSSCVAFISYNPSSGQTVQVTYSHDQSGLAIRRQEDAWDAAHNTFGTGSAQPFADLVQALQFSYYDAFSQPITPAAWTTTHRCPPVAGATAQSVALLTYAQMRQVQRVGILVRTAKTQPGLDPEFFTLTGDVYLRNK